MEIHPSKGVKSSVIGRLKLLSRCRGSPGISQQHNKLIAGDEQTPCGEKEKAIRAGLPEKKTTISLGLALANAAWR